MTTEPRPPTKCECCDEPLTFLGPVVRERIAMINAQPGERIRLPWACSVECFEVEMAAYYLLYEEEMGFDPDRFAIKMANAFKNMGTSSKIAAKTLRKFGAAL